MILSVRYGNCSTRVDLSYVYYLRHWRHLYYAVFQGILSDFIFSNIMLRYVNGIHLSAMWQNTTIVQSVIHRRSNYNKSRPMIWADTDICFIVETTVHSARRSEYDAAIKISSGNIIEWFSLCNSSLNKIFPENTRSSPNVGPSSATLSQHYSSFGPTSRVSLSSIWYTTHRTLSPTGTNLRHHKTNRTVIIIPHYQPETTAMLCG